MHDSWGVGLGFKGLTLRDAAGRTVLSAPSGKVGLDPFAMALLDVKSGGSSSTGSTCACGSPPTARSRLRSPAIRGRPPIPLPGATPEGGAAPNLAGFVRFAAEAMAGAAQALDRLTLANGNFEIHNDATQRSVVYKDFAVVFDHSGSRAHATISATGPAGPWTIAARASDGDAPALSLEARDLSLADLQAFDKKPPPLTADGPIAIKIEAEVTPQSTLRTFTGQFSVGAGHVRINNPDAVPFFIDEATGVVAWDEDARRFRVDKLEVLSGLTHVSMQGSLAPPADPDRVWSAHLEARDAQFARSARAPIRSSLQSIVADARFLEPSSRFIIDGLTARGPTVDFTLRLECRAGRRPLVAQAWS